ncbi:Aste57867_18373 [Aphanomyces stellatus]|uniref:oligopeptidase A n=1 Tax=Aphanomyces stellatus TaxID=120398 RepID=A0A485LBC3_9STRA|nr:hypothetical protein As57867_018311 [Aphanomyces stellatus]VFT95109.1 Aste57867_18373 [Aphanomyces stellatus]
MVNPLTRCVEDYALPPFASMRPSDIAPALRTAIDEMTLDLNSFEDDLDSPDAEFTWESVMDRLEIIDDPLDRLWRVVIHLTKVMNSPDLRLVEAEMQDEVLAIQNRRAQSPVIFHAMNALRASHEWATYSVEQKRILERAIQKATLSGVALNDNDRNRFNVIHARLTKLNSIYANNMLDAVKEYSLIVHEKEQLEGVPDSAMSLFAQNAVADGHEAATATAGPWKLSLENSVYSRVMSHCANRSLRETLYRASIAQASTGVHDNTRVIQEILQLRRDQATLLGFNTFAELSLATKLAPSVSAVQDLVEEFRSKAYPISELENQKLHAYAIAHGHVGPLERCDIAFWMERLRQDELDLNPEAIKPYFPLSRVLAGLFELMTQLFGIRIEAADGEEETWHPDVPFYQMRAMDQPDEPVIAQFFLDMFPRPGQKLGGAWIEVVASRSKVLRTEKFPVRVPVFALMFNITPPVDDAPTLLSVSDLDALFTVFGYGLRIAFTAAEHTPAARPTGIEWDCVNIPGNIMSRLFFHRDTIPLISGHVDTGEPLPQVLLDKLVAANHFMSATDFLGQLHTSVMDMALHHDFDPSSTDESIFDLNQRLAPRYRVIPLLPEDRTLCQNYHIFPGDYAAGYYSYLWCDVYVADAYAAFEEATGQQDVLAATGRKFRDTMFAQMGIVDANVAFEMFRGRKPDPSILAKEMRLE